MENRVQIADAVITKAGKLFIIKRGDPPCKGMYTLPGGTVEPGELPHQTVIREVFEETGLNIRADKNDVLGSVDIDVEELYGTVTSVESTIIGGVINLLTNEVIESDWISLDDFIKGHYEYGFSSKSIDEIKVIVSRVFEK